MKVDIRDDEGHDDIVEIENYDVWDYSTSLAPVIHAWMCRFKHCESGHDSAYTQDEWTGILDKMIWSFNECCTANDRPEDMTYEEMCRYERKIDEGLELFGRHFRSLWT